jgi:hypothetical protein
MFRRNTSVLCHEDISLVNIYFDAGHVAAGGLLLNNSMGCVISQVRVHPIRKIFSFSFLFFSLCL